MWLSLSVPDVLIRSMMGRMVRQHGINAEQKTVRLFKADGWFAARLRQGPIDVIAGKDGRTVLVQVKSGMARAKKGELESIVKWGRAFNADAEVWYFRGRGRVVKRRVYAAKRVSD